METSGFGFRFYNAGKRISELIRFSTTANASGQAEHGDGISYWPLDAPEKAWFFVPAELQCGTDIIRVDFAKDIQTKFGPHGVVLLDARHNPASEDPEKPTAAVAPTEEAVVARAEELWNSYTLSVIERHLADSDQALAAGGRPRKAMGFTKFCFKMHGKIDPGDTFAHTADVSKPSGDVSQVLAHMQQSQDRLTAVLLAIASGEKLDPEMVKALTTPATVSESAGKPVTSGIATGKITKPVDMTHDNWEKASPAPKGKSDRAKEAANAL